MGKNYSVIDSDGHVTEPADLWADYLDPAFREQGPHMFLDADGKVRARIEGKVYGGATGLMMYAPNPEAAKGTQNPSIIFGGYAMRLKGGFDPHARVEALEVDGIDAAFLYPTAGLFSGAVQDPSLAAAMCRAYNRWLADFCSAHPDRLFGVAMLPMQSVELAVQEMRYARRELGMKSGFIRPNLYNNRTLEDPAYDPLWREAVALDFAIGIHEGTGGMAAVGMERYKDLGSRHIISHTVEMMLSAVSLIWGGVCERFPTLRLAFLESGGGWMAAWLDRMDRHFANPSLFPNPALKMRPSEYFRRQCWVSYEPVEGSLEHLVDYIGADRILWATDYPHPDCFFPGAPKMIADKLSRKNKKKVLAESALAFYKLNGSSTL